MADPDREAEWAADDLDAITANLAKCFHELRKAEKEFKIASEDLDSCRERVKWASGWLEGYVTKYRIAEGKSPIAQAALAFPSDEEE